jgi:hypothetical protein
MEQEMKKALFTLALLGVAAFSLASAAAKPKTTKASAKPAANWSQWRGPSGQGISTETGVPTEWSGTKNIKWKTPVPGRGHSSPIVWGRPHLSDRRHRGRHYSRRQTAETRPGRTGIRSPKQHGGQPAVYVQGAVS